MARTARAYRPDTDPMVARPAAPRPHDDVGGHVGTLYRDLAGRFDGGVTIDPAAADLAARLIAGTSRAAGYALLLACYAAVTMVLLG